MSHTSPTDDELRKIERIAKVNPTYAAVFQVSHLLAALRASRTERDEERATAERAMFIAMQTANQRDRIGKRWEAALAREKALREALQNAEAFRRAYEDELDNVAQLIREKGEVETREEALREALQNIAQLALLPLVDMADPPEDRARDWAHVAKRAWTYARAALAAPPPGDA